MNEKLVRIAPALLRYGMSLVFLWFAYQQLTDTARWTSLVPEYVVSLSGLSAAMLVYLNGLFELVFGILLILGLFTRISALLLALHLIEITVTVGYNAIGVRDFGLCIATFAIACFGKDFLSLDTIMDKKQKV